MGISANQAKFLTITGRKIDLEKRMQQITSRRVSLAKQMKNIASKYNDAISDRKLYLSDIDKYERLTFANLHSAGLEVMDTSSNSILRYAGTMNKVTGTPAGTAINSQEEFIDLISAGGSINYDANTSYHLTCDVDLTGVSVSGNSVFSSINNGATFDGQGHTISGLNINSTSGDNVGLFSTINSGATVKNIVLEDANVTSTSTSSHYVGALAGRNSGTVDNVAVINTDVQSANNNVGAVAGRNDGTIKKTYSTGSVSGVQFVGGLTGQNSTTGTITNSYSSSSVTGVDDIGGFIGINQTSSGSVNNNYSDGNVKLVGTHPSGAGVEQDAGGFIGASHASAAINNNYSVSEIIDNSTGGASRIGGFAGDLNAVSADFNNTNFSNSDINSNTVGHIDSGRTSNVEALTTDEIADSLAPIDTYSSSIWHTEGSTPILIGTNDDSDVLEEGLRSGKYTLVQKSDVNTNNEIVSTDGQSYEEFDWRTESKVSDELYTGNDEEATAEYEMEMKKVLSKDKRYELEKTQIETEYTAVNSEREAVKKLITKNTEGSFKLFM